MILIVYFFYFLIEFNNGDDDDVISTDLQQGNNSSEPVNSGINNLNNSSDSLDFRFTLRKSAFRYRIAEGVIDNKSCIDWMSFLLASKNTLFKTINGIIKSHGSIKIKTRLIMEYSLNVYNRPDEPSNVVYENRNFGEGQVVLCPVNNLQEYFDENIVKAISESVEYHAEVGSGWAFSKVQYLHIAFFKHETNNCGSFIKLPTFIANKGSCINVQNTDNKCVLYSILAGLHHQRFPEQRLNNANRVNNYIHLINEVNMKNVSYPTSLNQFDEIERNNIDLSFNIFVLTKGAIHNSKKKKKKPTLSNISGIMPLNEDFHKFSVSLARKPKIIKKNHMNLLLFKSESKYSIPEELKEDLLLLKAFYGEEIEDEDILSEVPSEDEDIPYNIEIYEDFENYHFAYIKNLSGLLQGQDTLSDKKKIPL